MEDFDIENGLDVHEFHNHELSGIMESQVSAIHHTNK